MKFLALSFIAAALTAVVSSKPVTVPYAAVHGHKLQPAATNTTTTVSKAKTFAVTQLDSNVAFSTSGPKFVTYIDNTVSWS
jgi:hypothetical protein